MEAIDQAPFNFSPTVGLAVGVMVGFLVFAVALDLTWAQFHRVLRRPKAPLSREGHPCLDSGVVVRFAPFGIRRSRKNALP